MNDNEVLVNYDAESYTAICVIRYNGVEFVGKATCAEADREFASELTGCYIAEAKARIKLTKYKLRAEIKPILDAYLHLLDCMEHSNKHDPKNYESMMIHRKIHQYQNRYENYENFLWHLKNELNTYVIAKDKLYRRLRNKESTIIDLTPGQN